MIATRGQPPARSEDPSAEARFEDAYRTSGQAVLGYALRRAGSREDALDAVAETFATAWRRRRDMPAQADEVRPWLFAIARRCLADATRSATRAGRLGSALAAAMPAGAVPDPALLHEHRAVELLRDRTTSDGSPLASVLAAGQLADDAHRAGARRRARRRLVRTGTAVLVAAAAWAAVVVLVPGGTESRQADPPSSSPGAVTPLALTLAATGPVTFPLSLDPEPAGLTATFSQWGGTAYYPGPLVFAGDWMSADGDRVLLYLFPDEPMGPDYESYRLGGEQIGTADVGGAEATVLSSDGGTTLRWERPDGRWLQVSGEGRYADADALTAIARSVVDVPQPVGLQFGLAPAGWTVGGYEESRSLDLVSDTDPAQVPLRVSLTGTPGPDVTLDNFFEGRILTGTVEQLTVQGLPARLGRTSADDGDSWLMAGQVPDGRFFLLLGPPVLTRDQVVQIAEQITVTR